MQGRPIEFNGGRNSPKGEGSNPKKRGCHGGTEGRSICFPPGLLLKPILRGTRTRLRKCWEDWRAKQPPKGWRSERVERKPKGVRSLRGEKKSDRSFEAETRDHWSDLKRLTSRAVGGEK